MRVCSYSELLAWRWRAKKSSSRGSDWGLGDGGEGLALALDGGWSPGSDALVEEERWWGRSALRREIVGATDAS